MNKLILFIGLILVGCSKAEVKSQPQASPGKQCEIELKILHASGAENTIHHTFEIDSNGDCYIVAQRRLDLSVKANLYYRNKILATNVASYKIIESTDTY